MFANTCNYARARRSSVSLQAACRYMLAKGDMESFGKGLSVANMFRMQEARMVPQTRRSLAVKMYRLYRELATEGPDADATPEETQAALHYLESMSTGSTADTTALRGYVAMFAATDASGYIAQSLVSIARASQVLEPA